MKLSNPKLIPLPAGGGINFARMSRVQLPKCLAGLVFFMLSVILLAYEKDESEIMPIQMAIKNNKKIGYRTVEYTQWRSEISETSDREKDRQVVFDIYPELQQIEQIENESFSIQNRITRLYPFFDNRDPTIKFAALESIDGFDHPEAESVLVNLLYDESALIQIEALERLAEQARPELGAYVETLLFSSNIRVRIAAISALADLESVAMLPILESLLYDQTPQIRNAALSAIVDIQGVNLKKHINVLSRDEDDLVRANMNLMLVEQAFVSDD